jgi:hypothetical protein
MEGLTAGIHGQREMVRTFGMREYERLRLSWAARLKLRAWTGKTCKVLEALLLLDT